MTLNDHPQHPNNTIVEGLCEFRVTHSLENPWKTSIPRELISRSAIRNAPHVLETLHNHRSMMM